MTLDRRLSRLEERAFMSRAQFATQARQVMEALLEVVREEVRDPAALERIAARMRDGRHPVLPS